MLNKILADLLVAVHLAYVAFAVVGLLLILTGLALRWHWVGNLRFRVIHLVMVEVVALEGVFNIRCPLTDLEDVLRRPIAARMSEPHDRAALVFDDVVEAWELEFQPVFQQAEPGVAVFPPAEQTEQPADPQNDTFVGWLLGSILYVSVPQATLDKWYIVFGVVTLVVFVAFPPRRGTWTTHGFLGMILLWIGIIFQAANIYDVYLGVSIEDHKPPLALGAALIVLGAGCALAARRNVRLEATN